MTFLMSCHFSKEKEKPVVLLFVISEMNENMPLEKKSVQRQVLVWCE
jgi:hypothetical protein